MTLYLSTLVFSSFTLQCTLFTGLLSFLVYSLHLWYLHRKWDKLLSGPTRDSFYFGNYAPLRNTLTGKKAMAEYMYETSLVCGKTFKLFLFHRVIVMSLDEGILKELLINHEHPKSSWFYSNVSFPFAQRFVGHGLLSESRHEIWAHRRPIIQEAFSRRMLRKYASIMNMEAEEMVKEMNRVHRMQGLVDMSSILHWTTFSVICRAGFSMTSEELGLEGKLLFHDLEQLMVSTLASAKFPFFFNFICKKHVKDARSASTELRKLLYTRLKTRMVAMAQGEIPEKEDIVTYLIRSASIDNDYSIEEMMDDMATFLIGGSETTANMLSFALIMLCQNPKIMSRLQDELDAQITPGDKLTFDSVLRLEYMNWVFKEVLRMFPSVPGTSRITVKPIHSKTGTIPARTEVVLSIFSAGNHPDSCARADEFLPERFNKENDEDLERPGTYNYIPFSMGPRNCIGQIFSTLEAKILLIKILHTYNIRLAPGYHFKLGQTQFTIKPLNGTPIILQHHGVYNEE